MNEKKTQGVVEKQNGKDLASRVTEGRVTNQPASLTSGLLTCEGVISFDSDVSPCIFRVCLL